jgi:hypothetical protein
MMGVGAYSIFQVNGDNTGYGEKIKERIEDYEELHK